MHHGCGLQTGPDTLFTALDLDGPGHDAAHAPDLGPFRRQRIIAPIRCVGEILQVYRGFLARKAL